MMSLITKLINRHGHYICNTHIAIIIPSASKAYAEKTELIVTRYDIPQIT
jgi:hypothetical protein